MDDTYYTVLRAISAVLSASAGLLVALKNKHRWRRDSPVSLQFGARLWREMLIVLMAALCATYLQAAFRHAPGVPATVYVPAILALFNYGLFVEYREVRAREAIRNDPTCPRRRFDD